jgi:S-adenosylmethionine:tRNA ribosyltransferase-isomerase
MLASMQRTDFHFHLPQDLIAQRPSAARSSSRLLVLDGVTGAHEDLQFGDFPSLLRPSDLVVLNDTRVIPARLFGVKDSGGRIEIFLERALSANRVLAQVRASKGLREGHVVRLADGSSVRMIGREADLYLLEFSADALRVFETLGEMPLPPYIDRAADGADRERYQTVFARTPGAVAAPTAGLHFDAPLFETLAARGIKHTFVTLHVGAGTFAPVRTDDVTAHTMHAEYVDVPQATCEAIAATRAAGGRVIAVGTTVVRSLETAAAAEAAAEAGAGGRPPRGRPPQSIRPFSGMTRIFITPGYKFRAVDAIVTNFHLPESTLLMLCSAFVGREVLLSAYRHAVQARYRFFSYGDAMFMTPAASARVPV